MTSNILGADGDAFVPDPEEWPEPEGADVTPEVLRNEPDDLAASLPGHEAVPFEADEADVLDQFREGGPDAEDEARVE